MKLSTRVGTSSWYVTEAPPHSQLILLTCAVASSLILKVFVNSEIFSLYLTNLNISALILIINVDELFFNTKTKARLGLNQSSPVLTFKHE